EPPKYFAMMKLLNKVPRPLLVEVPQHPKLTQEQLLKAYNKGMTVIDTRNTKSFAKGYLPHTLNSQHSNSFATRAGWVLNYEEQFILNTDEENIEELTRKLMRIGLDNIYGYIDDISDLGIDLQQQEIIDMQEFEGYIGNPEVQ